MEFCCSIGAAETFGVPGWTNSRSAEYAHDAPVVCFADRAGLYTAKQAARLQWIVSQPRLEA